MSDGLTFVVGIGIVSLILYVLSTMISEEEHPILKFFFVMSILALMLLIPKAFGDELRTCEAVVANSTVTANLTSYSYTSYCYTEASTTNGTFMQVIFWVYRAIIAYLIVFFFIQACKALLGMRGGRV